MSFFSFTHSRPWHNLYCNSDLLDWLFFFWEKAIVQTLISVIPVRRQRSTERSPVVAGGAKELGFFIRLLFRAFPFPESPRIWLCLLSSIFGAWPGDEVRSLSRPARRFLSGERQKLNLAYLNHCLKLLLILIWNWMTWMLLHNSWSSVVVSFLLLSWSSLLKYHCHLRVIFQGLPCVFSACK